ncbi:rRNA maturation RNase YbeY [Ornithinimicrobium sp. Arc0846-15]|nr:rRNA maturation RNase YbeY [Ornithinimicrobium laminariae]
MSIEVLNESGQVPSALPEQEFQDLARFVLEAMHVHPAAELTITLVDTAAMEALHVQWMDLEGPTDVMSFPMDELRPGSHDQPSTEGILGDVVLCSDVAAQQAAAAGHSVADELLLLTTHGILHLLGFDHADEAEEKEMFDLQRTLLLSYLAQRGRTTSAAPAARRDRA